MIGSVSGADAQDLTSSPFGDLQNGASSSRENGTTSDSPTIEPDILYLQGADGRPIPVPANASLDEYLEWVKNRNGQPPAAPSDYSVTELSLDGTADDERATLDAVVTIQINADDQWVQVPLRLDEAILREAHYSGDGKATFGGKTADSGYQWWFRGKGLHRLALSLTVPVRRLPPDRRLQLAVPETAVSYLKLLVPLRRISAKSSEESSLTTTTTAANTSQIEMRGLGRRVNLSWTPLPDEQQDKSPLEAKTRITVELTGEACLWTVHQEVRAAEGVFDQLTVRLPRTSELIGLEWEGVKGSYVQEFDEENGRQVMIALDQPTTGPIELQWNAVSRIPAKGGSLTVEGFDVAGARHQRGDIEISTAESLRVSARNGEGQYVYRKKVGNSTSAMPLAKSDRSYQFFKQPFQLVLDVEEVEPYFSVEPQLLLLLSKDHMTLDATFLVEVSRPAVQRLELEWPDAKSEGWIIEPAEDSDLIDRIVTSTDPEGRISIALVEPQSSSFAVRLRASRPVTQTDSRFPITLPVPIAPSPRPSVLVAAYADNIEAGLVSAGDTVLRPLPSAARESLNLPLNLLGLRRDEFRIDTRAHSLSAALTVHPQEIRATTAVDVHVDDGHAQVLQRIAYDVLYERLSEVRLLVPDSIRNRVTFYSDQGEKYSAVWSGLDADSTKEARLILDETRIGQIEILARFEMNAIEGLNTGTQSEFAIPLVRSSDAEYREIHVQVQPPPGITASLPETAWTEQWNTYDSPEWIANSPQADIPLTLEQATRMSSNNISVPRSVHRTTFDRLGSSDHWALMRVAGTVSTLDIALPADAIQPEFRWDSSRLPADRITETASAAGHYLLTISQTPTETEGLLEITYHVNAASRSEATTKHQIAAPQLPADVWVAETVWEVILPYEQYLFANPSDLLPRFRWEWNRFYFSRRPELAYANMRAWIGGGTDLAALPQTTGGNLYTFSQIGPAGTIEFRSISQPMLVLTGAGLALAMGFVLLKIPFTRNVLTLLVAAFLVAVAGLWYTPQLQLLLQPALFGLSLAILAAIIEGLLTRHRERRLAHSSPSNFLVGPASSSLHQPPAGFATEAPTSIRRPGKTQGSSHALSASDSGRRL